ncbi:glycosyltransferase family 2 protein [Mesoterricola sediminis]|uniref:Glycosyltransferase 2-like domain-containing protein n=1 Tax=Mesoterricola sediminis TaxID=2927980 RepID=A0AA48GVM0_9BACT|nr:glycosyltransferase family 2 protein [Mesoterricola sediminis]BDU75225.1 hypothetical protein METESE_01830 [Mesoterricola sediminis]
MTTRPLVSICVPTMDRGELLEIGLKNLLSEAEPFGDKVEIVVADNASTDATPEILRSLGGRIRVGRQPERVTFPRNLLYAACDLARGEHVLLMGDDDLLVRGSLKRIVDLLEARPDLDYIYLNVGWLSVPQRNRAILEDDSRIPEDYDGIFQLREPVTRVLGRLEEVVDLCWSTPYAMFSTIFCYTLRRSRYLEEREHLALCDDWDHAVQPLDNMFPHALLSLRPCAGRPAGCIGEPAVMQGSWHQGWAPWSHKTMIHGHVLLFEWLERETAFDPERLGVLWKELARHSANMLIQMLDHPERHLGRSVLEGHALPRLIRHPEFLTTLWDGTRNLAQADFEADRMEERVAALDQEFGRPVRVALWGLRGRGERWLEHHAARLPHLEVIVDGSHALHGKETPWLKEPVQPVEALLERTFDVLVLGTREEITAQILPVLAAWVPVGTPVVSMLGLTRVSPAAVEAGAPSGAMGLPSQGRAGA